jgi:hypothetical protein
MSRRGFIIFKCGAILFLLVSWTGNSVPVRAQGKTTKERTPAAAKSMIGNIADKNAPDGCGCSFSLPAEERKRSPRYAFASDLDEKDAWMNIDGQDVKLRLVQSTGSQERAKMGSRLTRTYAAAGIKVLAVYVTTRICKPDDESCESTDYRASFTVKKGGRQQTVRLKGSCGC